MRVFKLTRSAALSRDALDRDASVSVGLVSVLPSQNDVTMPLANYHRMRRIRQFPIGEAIEQKEAAVCLIRAELQLAEP